ncbi:MAG TPA: tRNA lysidine(34) synthetase TilS [Planctomycetota bacterium]|nr:tRNA lysidine(34) synthetase TilS [Planctomycetota bacterium]
MSDLSRDLQQRVVQAIETHGLTPKGEPLMLALSSGRDSVCLVSLFHALLPWGRWKLTAVHFDHALRGPAATVAETECCQALCDNLGIPLHAETLEIRAAPGESLETAARTARLSAFRRLAQETGIVHVATAHQADDRIETLLFRLLRGTGLRGLPGIGWQRKEPVDAPRWGGLSALTFHRPLLSLWRTETTEYCRAKGLNWIDDPTNESDAHTRNRIRRSLVPRLEEFNLEARQHLWDLAQDAEEALGAETLPPGDEDATKPAPGIFAVADAAIEPPPETADAAGSEDAAVEFPFRALPWTLDGATLLALGRVRAIAAMQRILETARRLNNAPGAPSRPHYDQLWTMLFDPAAPAALDLPGRWRIRRVGTPPHARLTVDRIAAP